MTIAVDAIYEGGMLKLKSPVDLPERAEVHLTIEPAATPRTPLGRRLRELREEILADGTPTLGWDGITEEVATRRGGWREPR
ncbi:MAG: antitoxin family protein [Acidobacteria bacterium]|nr:antitoxin family protein [Acidobacteriota bacterium]